MSEIDTKIAANREINARGSFCPGPLLELIRGIRESDIGETLAILSGDAGSRKDIPAWVAKAGHEMLGVEDHDGYARFVVRKVR